MLNHRVDIAGIGAAWHFASENEPGAGLAIRSVHQTTTYFRWPADIEWRRKRVLVLKLYRSAHVIHLNNSARAYNRLAHSTGRRPPGLLHHHGSPFRTSPEAGLESARAHGFVSAVSTLDLTEPAPDELHWLPAPINVRSLAKLRQRHRREPDGRVLIVHAPTKRSVKATAELIDAVETLRREGLPVDLDIVENRPNEECLARKARADLYFDQVALGYGMNAIEAWAMGIPVIAGAGRYTLGRMEAEFDGAIPFARADRRTITKVLRRLVVDEEERRRYAELGQAHVLRFHDELPALLRLAELYMLAIEEAATPQDVVV